MAFDNTVLATNADLPTGEVIKSLPNAVMAFELFENGLIEGRFCKFAAGQIDNLDGSATPRLAGVVRRKLTGEIGSGVYSTTGEGIDQVAEVCNFGFVTVTVTSAATPVKYDQVYTINADTADRGKATDDSGALIVPGAIFWEEKAANVWLVRVMMGVETSTSYVAAPSNVDFTIVDEEDGTATLTIQVQDAAGGDFDAYPVLGRLWVGGANDFGVDAITDIAITTGTVKQIITAEGENLLITSATGEIVAVLDNNGAGTIYGWFEVGGIVYPTGAIVITA
jgi:hypothetical protein